jgi:hypothetical protein
MDDLKLCSTCGSPGSKVIGWPFGDGVFCSNPNCRNHNSIQDITTWQSRPLESQQAARILQLEQQLAAATERATGLEQDYRGLLHKADSWERGMEWNAQLCAEKDARIAELETGMYPFPSKDSVHAWPPKSASVQLTQEITDYIDAQVANISNRPSAESRFRISLETLRAEVTHLETVIKERDARIEELEFLHLVEDGDYPEDGQEIVWTNGGTLYTDYEFVETSAVAWFLVSRFMSMVEQKRARRAAEAAAGGEVNNG